MARKKSKYLVFEWDKVQGHFLNNIAKAKEFFELLKIRNDKVTLNILAPKTKDCLLLDDYDVSGYILPAYVRM